VAALEAYLEDLRAFSRRALRLGAETEGVDVEEGRMAPADFIASFHAFRWAAVLMVTLAFG
jgi:hypothetical protein